MSNVGSNKVAFITGANRGIGLQTALELGKQGITVVLGTRDVATGEKAAADLRAQGVKAEVVAYDAARPDSDRAVATFLETRFGKLDILVNNAGVMTEDLTPGAKDTASITSAKLHDTFEVNFFAVVRLTQTLLPLIRKSDAGRIVNVSSILGSLTVHSAPASPIAGMKPFAYNASKTALNAFTVHLADELRGTNIKVNSAHPGWVKTPLGGPNAPMDVSESGQTSVRLATLGADGPTGSFFHTNDQLPW